MYRYIVSVVIGLTIEKEVSDDVNKCLQSILHSNCQRYFRIHNNRFKVIKCYGIYFHKLIDACNFNRCINWDAAHDSNNPIRINIPIYDIICEINVKIMDNIEVNLPFTLASYGIHGIPINYVINWYKNSPHFQLCRDIRYKWNNNDMIQCMINQKWINGVIISNNVIDFSYNNQNRKQSVIEYLLIYIKELNHCMYINRYDENIRPILTNKNEQKMMIQSKKNMDNQKNIYNIILMQKLLNLHHSLNIHQYKLTKHMERIHFRLNNNNYNYTEWDLYD